MKIEKIPRLKTENYQLRGLRIRDARALYPFMSDQQTMKYITPHPVRSLPEMEEEIKAILASFAKQKDLPWVIENTMGEVVGFFRLHKLNLWHRKAEMGAIISPEYQRTGVMTEVLAAVLRFGFKQMQLNRIVGDIFARNKGSRKLLQKFGFRQEGILRQTDFDGEEFHDTVVFSLLKSEYEALNHTFD